ncbi:MAG: PEP-CTERM sorting domain-containing protein [Planctomycetes bacterium]|nr:PEP-CTERM sorting domain-containing protein [Planctomycetota bacterium]
MVNRSAFVNCVGAVLVVFASSHWVAAGNLEDFQNDVEGTRPTNAENSSNAPGNGTDPNNAFDPANLLYARNIVTSSRNGTDADGIDYPADPFGGVGNQSLLMDDNRNINNSPKVLFGTDPISGADTFSTKLYFFTGVTGVAAEQITWSNPYSEIRIGNPTGVFPTFQDTHNWWQGDMAMWLIFSDTTLRIGQLNPFDPTDRLPDITLDNAIPLNTVINLSLSFDTTTDSFTGLLNGVALTAGGGATTSFNFASPQTSINAVEFVGGYNTKMGVRYFIDDVALTGITPAAPAFAVPEPSSLLLVLLGGGLALSATQRTRRKV